MALKAMRRNFQPQRLSLKPYILMKMAIFQRSQMEQLLPLAIHLALWPVPKRQNSNLIPMLMAPLLLTPGLTIMKVSTTKPSPMASKPLQRPVPSMIIMSALCTIHPAPAKPRPWNLKMRSSLITPTMTMTAILLNSQRSLLVLRQLAIWKQPILRVTGLILIGRSMKDYLH